MEVGTSGLLGYCILGISSGGICLKIFGRQTHDRSEVLQQKFRSGAGSGTLNQKKKKKLGDITMMNV